jgi:hypothetical protein
MLTPVGDPADTEDALRRLRDVLAAAVAAVRDAPDAQRTFEALTALTETLRVAVETVAGLRAGAAARIADEEGLSLAGLAQRISVSKQRAGRLVQNARRWRDEEE